MTFFGVDNATYLPNKKTAHNFVSFYMDLQTQVTLDVSPSCRCLSVSLRTEGDCYSIPMNEARRTATFLYSQKDEAVVISNSETLRDFKITRSLLLMNKKMINQFHIAICKANR